ncbi:hypothetical protein [Pseudozobellia thermophila]|uniref:Uncharacterized protein n=1 Tax=Pseudozobellia thermophila TaxID=192903 RepID=A0A1M6JFP7_9FLAO|nr:hypothetical protein [Pseudozobellia thermophila]SHJ45480.1 hypothetical protein SAMN04488513_1055 [Pseudozobellia thermophila]
MELLLIILIPIIIWIASIYMLTGWDKFNVFFIANGILISVYVCALIFGKSIWPHDEYGLGFLYRLAICLLSHVLIVFVFAIIKNRQLKK